MNPITKWKSHPTIPTFHLTHLSHPLSCVSPRVSIVDDAHLPSPLCPSSQANPITKWKSHPIIPTFHLTHLSHPLSCVSPRVSIVDDAHLPSPLCPSSQATAMVPRPFSSLHTVHFFGATSHIYVASRFGLRNPSMAWETTTWARRVSVWKVRM